MKTIPFRCLAIVPMLPLLGGCSFAGTGPLRDSGQDYARSVYTLYDQPKPGAPPAAVTLRFPMDVAVAEVGQVTPLPLAMEQLRSNPQLVRRAEGIPALDESDAFGPATTHRARDAQLSMIYRLGQMARGMGLDYLLLFGVTAESRSTQTELSGLDMTIVGGFVVPSWELTAQSRASAVLVDLRSNSVVLTAGAASSDSRMSPSITTSPHLAQLEDKVRGDAFHKLNAQIVEDLARRSKLPQAARPAAEARATPASKDPFATFASPKAADPAVQVIPRGGVTPTIATPAFRPLPPDPLPSKSSH